MVKRVLDDSSLPPIDTHGDPQGPARDRGADWVASTVRSRVLVPLGAALLLVAVVLGIFVATSSANRAEDEAARMAAQVKQMLGEHTLHGVETMQTVLDVLMRDPALQAAMRAGDQGALLAATQPLMEGLRVRNDITHLYFHRPDRTVLLRSHEPSRFDDRVDRHVLLDAERTRKPAWGNEQGFYGTYTLRVASPWIVDGTLIGYTEAGIEFEELVADVRKTFDADFFVVLEKRLFDAEGWKKLQGSRPHPIAWDEFPRHVMISRTTEDVPAAVGELLAADRNDADVLSRVASWGQQVANLISTPLMNVRNEPLGELIVVQDVTASARERRNALAAVFLTIGSIGGVLMLVSYIFLGRVQREVVHRTGRLNEAQGELQQQQARNQLLEVRGQMVEQLAEANRVAENALRENEDVTEKLRQTQSELVAAAREAGRAEIATNVLHNVGNVLNSVNISAAVIGSTLRKSRLAGLARGVQMLACNEAQLATFLTQDEKGRKLPGYLQAATEAVGKEHEQMGEELGRLVKSIDHIKDVVATQQSHGASRSVVEPAQPTDLVEDALRMQGSALARHQVAVVRDYRAGTALPLDRGRVLQILVNLVSNAKAAMSAENAAGQHMTVRVLHQGDRLRFVVEDQGEGIPPENLTRIFTHGFTTRRNGHGFGLHSSALAAREMGGSLTVASSGPGQGAAFTLDLPVGPPPQS